MAPPAEMQPLVNRLNEVLQNLVLHVVSCCTFTGVTLCRWQVRAPVRKGNQQVALWLEPHAQVMLLDRPPVEVSPITPLATTSPILGPAGVAARLTRGSVAEQEVLQNRLRRLEEERQNIMAQLSTGR